MTAKTEQITLPAVLDIAAATPLRDLLSQALLNQSDLLLDACDIEHISTPCIQILIAVDLEITRRGSLFTLINIPEALTEAIISLGLAQQLTKWSS